MAKDAPEIIVSGTDDVVTEQYLYRIVDEVVETLPGGFLDGLLKGNKLRIHIKDLNRKLSPADFCKNAGKLFGEYDRRRKRIVVSSKLVELARASAQSKQSDEASGGQDFACSHGTFAQTLRATVVHELGHVYDRRHRVSAMDSFDRLVGGQTQYHPFRKNKIRNFNFASSPDTYEFKNRKEAFAVNLEYYVLDDQYSCRRPAYSHLFDSVFGNTAEGACDSSASVLLHSQILADNLSRSVSIDTKRVYEIHYLFASSGSSVASKWGHGMFRLITCAPDRVTVGPECLEDITHHIVLSYRANVADITINYLKGLLGDYPSQLFVYELPEIIKEYTRLEFRDLISVPLQLSPVEKDQFINISLERYWNYEGKYYFVTNHCGTEALNHLRATQDGLADHVTSLTPKRLLKSLHRARLVDESVYRDVTTSTAASPYYFPSKQRDYEDALDVAKQFGLFRDKSLKEVIKKSSPEEREVAYESILAAELYLDSATTRKRQLLTSLTFLERLLRDNEQDRIAAEAIKILVKGKSSLIDSIRVEMAELHGKPWELVDNGSYGVPSHADLEEYLKASDSRRSQSSDIYAMLKQYAPLVPTIERLSKLATLEEMLTQELVGLDREESSSMNAGEREIRE